MKVGFSGSREGMTDIQRRQVDLLLMSYVMTPFPVEFHHGDCTGSDFQAHQIARRIGYHIVVHPPTNDYYRAFCDGDEIREPKPYGVRDKDIVDETELLIATPRASSRGTWKTVGFARSAHKQYIVVNPDGSWDWREAREPIAGGA